MNFNCDNCNLECSRPHWEYKRTVNHYCSQSCAKSHKNRISAPIPNVDDTKYCLKFIKTIIKNKKNLF